MSVIEVGRGVWGVGVEDKGADMVYYNDGQACQGLIVINHPILELNEYKQTIFVFNRIYDLMQ